MILVVGTNQVIGVYLTMASTADVIVIDDRTALNPHPEPTFDFQFTKCSYDDGDPALPPPPPQEDRRPEPRRRDPTISILHGRTCRAEKDRDRACSARPPRISFSPTHKDHP